MSYDNPATHGLFEELLAGATAVKERPQLIAERDRALSEVEFHKSRLTDTQDTLTAAREVISDSNAKIAKLEADLAAATFREQEVRTKLESLVTTFKAVIGEVKAAADLANELVEEPKVETATAVSAAEGSSNNDAVSVPSDPTQTDTLTSHDPSSDSTTGTTTTSADTGATDLPGKFPWDEYEHPMDTMGRPQEQYASAGTFNPSPTEAAREPEVNPTLPTVQVADMVSTSVSATTSPVQPSSRQYWEKPSNTTWLEWRNLGNDIAPWCRNMSDESLSNIFN